MSTVDDLVKEFLVESYENLDQLDRDFVALEIDPGAADRIASIFRTIHTIKGTCGCLGLGKLEGVAHVGESLLSSVRDGDIAIDGEITSGLLKLVDCIRDILRQIEATGSEGTADYTALCRHLTKLNRPGLASPAVEAAEAALEKAVELTAHVAAELAPVATRVEPIAATETPDRKAAAPENGVGNAIRVDVDLLDKLMTLVGELVLARNQVLQYTAAQKDPALLRTTHRLNIITTELQEGVMKTRMQPIGNLWNKFPRVVRDVATSCGKRVRLELEGRETELDKTIIEAIKDPLTHVIRNSVDHGVETPENRRAAGKPEEGRLSMRAFHEGGQVNIEITDDGRGIDPLFIKRKAVDKGLISADQAARMSEREAINLIFAPGFSTAEKVTSVSGRGVGMDVVKTNIERIGGTIDVQSRVGQGTSLRIKIPLTLAIIPALIVTSGGERFAIPQVSLLELVRLDDDNRGVERIKGTALYRLRGNLLPLVDLNGQLKLASNGVGRNIVVLRGGERTFGLVVDHINDTEEIVVKPLAKQFKGIGVFAGATIMGDGKIALILDVLGLAQEASLALAAAGDTGNDRTAVVAAAKQTLLLFQLAGERRMAMPLSTVSRLEEFPRSRIEDAGGQRVVQYRGRIMPLVSVAEVLGDRRTRARMSRVNKATADTDVVQVVVYMQGDRHVGLLVEKILDVIEQTLDVESSAARPGVIGTAVIKDRVVELLDVPAVVDAAAALLAA